MTVLCHGDCHVWLGSSALCTCEVEMIFQGYNPFANRNLPPNEVPLANLKAAHAVNATHLSPDGLIAYDKRTYGTWYCTWDAEKKRFSSWWPIGGLPSEAVKLDS